MEFFSSDSRLVVDGSRASFSGFRSGIDFRGTVDAIMEARRFPIDRMESQVEARSARLAAYDSVKSRLNAVQTSLSNLYGDVALGDANDVFEAKQAFTSTSRSDGGTPAQAANLLSVNVSNAANAADHELEILQVAKAQKIASDGVADASADLGLSGDFDVGGVTVSVQAGDSLRDIRDRFNAANSGDNASGVSASVVQASASDSVLVLTNDTTGEAIQLTDTSGVLQSLGLVDGTGAVQNELQAAQNAKFKADGLTVANALQGDGIADPDAPLSDAAGIGSGTGTLQFDYTDADGTARSVNVDYDTDADSLTELARRIDFAAGDGTLNAAVVADGGNFRLQVSQSTGDAVSVSDAAGTLAGDMNLTAVSDAERVLTRSENTVDDLFQGVTLDLFQAEVGTKIDLEIENDLNGIKESLVGFVESYNQLKQYINAQRQDVELEGMAEGEAGALRRDRTLAEVEQRMNRILAEGSEGGTGFEVLAQVGIDFANNDALANPTLQDTLTIDEQKLNDELLNNLDQVRDLFAFDMTASSSDVSLINFTGSTQHEDAGSHNVEVQADADGNVVAARINGVDAEVSGNTIRAADGSGGADGIALFYNGGDTGGTFRSIDFNVSTGVGSQMFFGIQDMLADSGPIESEIGALEDQNAAAQERIDRQLERLDYQRERMLERFVEMERQLAEMDRIRSSIEQMASNLSGNG